MVTEKEMDLPFSEAVMLRVLPEKLAVTDDGLGGSVPSSYFCKSWLISACRHAQSFLVDTLPPPWKVKGSLSALETGVPRPSGTAGQLDGVPPPPPGAGVVLVGGVEVTLEVLRVVDGCGGLDGAVVVAVPGIHWWYH